MTDSIARSLVLRCVPAAVVLGVMFSIVLAMPANVSADATHPKWVNGYITDIMGNQLGGASVSVTIDGNTKTETADGNGFYQVQYLATEWTVGSNILVEVTYQSQQASNTDPADDSFVQEVNVQYPYEIPQFGGSVGLLLAGGFVAAVSIFLLSGSRRK